MRLGNARTAAGDRVRRATAASCQPWPADGASWGQNVTIYAPLALRLYHYEGVKWRHGGGRPFKEMKDDLVSSLY